MGRNYHPISAPNGNQMLSEFIFLIQKDCSSQWFQRYFSGLSNSLDYPTNSLDYPTKSSN